MNTLYLCAKATESNAPILMLQLPCVNSKVKPIKAHKCLQNDKCSPQSSWKMEFQVTICNLIYITEGFIRAWRITVNVRSIYFNKVLKIKIYSFALLILSIFSFIIDRENWMSNHLQVKATFLKLWNYFLNVFHYVLKSELNHMLMKMR